MNNNFKYLKINIYFAKNYNNVHYFIGSTLRGVFGHSLKKVCCINPSQVCENCFAAQSCLYYEFYEAKNSTHKFRFDFSLGQNGFDFSLYLFEDACDKLPYIVSAINMAALNYEFNKTKLTIKAITADDKLIFDGKNFDLSGVSPTMFAPKPLSNTLSIELLTPLRLKSNGKFMQDITPLAFLLSIDKKYKELKNINEKSHIANIPVQKEANLEFVDLERYSNRQKTKMGLGGFTGILLYENIDENSATILQIGEIIGVGKSTVFGLGKIKIREMN